jgi:uncharacterized RDD family membrane protein YckC
MRCSSCGAKVADGTAFCGACGRPIVGYKVGGSTGSYGAAAPSYEVPPMATPAGAYAGAVAPPAYMPVTVGGVAYAGFWMRAGAAIIDDLILGIPFGIIFAATIAGMIPAFAQMGQTPNPMLFVGVLLPRIFFALILYLVASWLYRALMESSAWQATLGKKALGLYVTDLNGRPATFGRTTARFFGGRGIGLFVGLYLLVDCILAGFTEKKQALHDIIAGTLVMRRV